MDHEAMKLECVRIVMARDASGDMDHIRAEAMKLYNFIRGRELDDNGGESVSYRADRITTPKAVIYRDPPFKDYKPE